MKKLENILLKACGYTILILVLFYLFAAFNNFGESEIGFSTFALIFAFGILISLTTLILGFKKPSLPFRILIHYGSLLLAFFAVFVAGGKISADSPSKIFSAVIIFTVLYALIFGIVYLVRRLVKSADNKIDKKQKPKSEYKSIYSGK